MACASPELASIIKERATADADANTLMLWDEISSLSVKDHIIDELNNGVAAFRVDVLEVRLTAVAFGWEPQRQR